MGLKDPTEEEGKDRISDLPDSILIHILSLLPTTKHALRTGTLSKRWLSLWTHLPHLVFCYDGGVDYYDLRDFVNFVDKTLTLHASPILHKFQVRGLHVNGVKFITDRVRFWLRLATLRQARDLSLCIEWPHVFVPLDDDEDPSVCDIIPQLFYTNPSLLTLKTECCNFAPSGKVEWTSLRVLDIGFSKFSPETLRSILMGSPALESMKLYRCFGIDEVDIGSSCSKLKTLVVDDLWLSLYDREYRTYLISGSSIQHLEIYGTGFQMWELDNVPSIVSVKLDFIINDQPWEEDEEDEYHEMCRQVVRKLLEKVSRAEQLELGSWCIQVLSTLEVKGVPTPLIGCKQLIFSLQDINRYSFPGMACLLRSSYKLEKFAIYFSWRNNNWQFDDPNICEDMIEDNYWRSNKRICNYLFSHLEIIEIFYLSDRVYKEGLLFQLIEFLLTNARLLKSMDVHRSKYWTTENALTMVEELLSFPRSSPCAVVMSRK